MNDFVKDLHVCWGHFQVDFPHCDSANGRKIAKKDIVVGTYKERSVVRTLEHFLNLSDCPPTLLPPSLLVSTYCGVPQKVLFTCFVERRSNSFGNRKLLLLTSKCQSAQRCFSRKIFTPNVWGLKNMVWSIIIMGQNGAAAVNPEICQNSRFIKRWMLNEVELWFTRPNRAKILGISCGHISTHYIIAQKSLQYYPFSKTILKNTNSVPKSVILNCYDLSI